MTRPTTIDEWLIRAYRDGGKCPPPELFLPSEWGDLDDVARDEAMRHLETCPACASERELALAFEAPPVANPSAEEDLAAILSRIETGSSREASGSILRFPLLSRIAPRGAFALAAAALMLLAASVVVRTRGAAPELPPRPDEEVTRGGRVTLVSPSGDVDQLPSSFDWREIDGATSYRVTLTSVDDTVLWSGTASRPPLALPAEIREALEARVVYFWRVEAFDPEGTRVGWSASARFRSNRGTENSLPSRPRP